MRSGDTKRKMSGLIALVIVAILAIICCCMQYQHNNSYSGQEYTERNYHDLTNRRNYNVVLYKPDCPYCKGAKKAVIKASHQGNIPTAFISTESTIGKQLVEKYQIVKADTIIEMRNGYFNKSLIYAEKVHGKYQADSKILQEAFN